jgi:hypothetical protein
MKDNPPTSYFSRIQTYAEYPTAPRFPRRVLSDSREYLAGALWAVGDVE